MENEREENLEKELSFVSPKEQLQIVNTAIQSVLEGGQSYNIGTRMLTRANLTELVRLQKSLMGLVAQDDNNNLFSDTYRAVFDGR